MGTWRTERNQNIQGYLENRRKPGYPGVPGEQKEIRISRSTWRQEDTRIFSDTWRTGGNQDIHGSLENKGYQDIHGYIENSKKPVYPGVPGKQEETRISRGEETVIFRGTWRTGGNSDINGYLN